MIALALLLIASQAEPFVGEIKERLAAEVRATFASTKKPYDLEICTADVVSVLGTPTVLRDGPTDVVMIVALGQGAYLGSLSMHDVPGGSTLELRLRGKGWDDRLKERIQACM